MREVSQSENATDSLVQADRKHSKSGNLWRPLIATGVQDSEEVGS